MLYIALTYQGFCKALQEVPKFKCSNIDSVVAREEDSNVAGVMCKTHLSNLVGQERLSVPSASGRRSPAGRPPR